MINKLFLIDFSGGPKDGLTVAVDFVPNQTLAVSAVDASQTSEAPAQRQQRVASYGLAWTCLSRDAEGLPFIHARYRFSGVEARPVAGVTRFVRRFARLLPRSSDHWMTDCRTKLAHWMLAPVDYPLKTSHLAPPLSPPDSLSGQSATMRESKT